tara:strand:+ start:3098 stop:4042 length:945 start_codon:yes stop_codon:yes gene_type:complete
MPNKKKNKSEKKAKTTLDLQKLKEIYTFLHLNRECAGTLIEKNNVIENFTVLKGDTDSVRTPLSTFNWHSHPIFLYVREGVSWGWPSGEDMREVIFFGLGGNRAHFVFSVEGVYALSLTPCFKKWLKNIIEDGWDRGIIVAMIEMIFKSTHNLRTTEYNELYPLTPDDWIKMVRNLRVNYLFEKKEKQDPCGKITCAKITTHDMGSRDRELMTVHNYAEVYEGEKMTVYKVGKNGSINGSKEMPIKEALERLEQLSVNLKKSCPNSRLYNINFFKNDALPLDLYEIKASERNEKYKELPEDAPQPPNKLKKLNF